MNAAASWRLPGDRAPLYQRLYSLIDGKIAAGIWREGHRLPQERELTILCGVCRGTVRKALALLESEGRVIRRPRLGTVVRAPSTDLGRDTQLQDVA